MQSTSKERNPINASVYAMHPDPDPHVSPQEPGFLERFLTRAAFGMGLLVVLGLLFGLLLLFFDCHFREWVVFAGIIATALFLLFWMLSAVIAFLRRHNKSAKTSITAILLFGAALVASAVLLLTGCAVFGKRGSVERGVGSYYGQLVLMKENTSADGSQIEYYEFRNGIWHGPQVQKFDQYGG